MFDKQLCKLIGKPEITISDVVEYSAMWIASTVIYVIVAIIAVFCIGSITLLLMTPYIQTDYSQNIPVIFGVGVASSICGIIVGLIIINIMSAIGSVKIATCPKKK